jgi:hypothetical protein
LIAAGCVVATIEIPSALAGGFFMLVGSGIHFWSKAILEQNRRLTTAGPYRWTRNPFYLGNLLIDLGLCFVIGHLWLAIIFLPIWIFSYHQTIAREEQRLLSLFPDEFPRYREAVPRLIPTGRRLDVEHASGVFSLSNDALAKGSEYARLLGIWLAPGVIWAAEHLRSEKFALFESQNSETLALLLFLPVAWICKLAVAETFRRPQTALLPFSSQPVLQHGMTLTLFGLAYVTGPSWLMNLPILWGLLTVLDGLGESRAGREEVRARILWPYFPAIATGAVLGALCVALLVHRAVVAG